MPCLVAYEISWCRRFQLLTLESEFNAKVTEMVRFRLALHLLHPRCPTRQSGHRVAGVSAVTSISPFTIAFHVCV